MCLSVCLSAQLSAEGHAGVPLLANVHFSANAQFREHTETMFTHKSVFTVCVCVLRGYA